MTDQRVAVIIAAFRAEAFIGQAVGSVMNQTHGDWEIWIIADDGQDYEEVLAEQGFRDKRLRFLSSARMVHMVMVSSGCSSSLSFDSRGGIANR